MQSAVHSRPSLQLKSTATCPPALLVPPVLPLRPPAFVVRPPVEVLARPPTEVAAPPVVAAPPRVAVLVEVTPPRPPVLAASAGSAESLPHATKANRVETALKTANAIVVQCDVIRPLIWKGPMLKTDQSRSLQRERPWYLVHAKGALAVS